MKLYYYRRIANSKIRDSKSRRDLLVLRPRHEVIRVSWKIVRHGHGIRFPRETTIVDRCFEMETWTVAHDFRRRDNLDLRREMCGALWVCESVRETFSRKLRQCKWNVASLMKCSILEKRYFETGAEEGAYRLVTFN